MAGVNDVRGPRPPTAADQTLGAGGKAAIDKAATAAEARAFAEGAFDAVFFSGSAAALVGNTPAEPISAEGRAQQTKELFTALADEFLGEAPNGPIAESLSTLTEVVERYPALPYDVRTAASLEGEVADRFWSKVLEQVPDTSKMPGATFMQSAAAQQVLKQLGPMIFRQFQKISSFTEAEQKLLGASAATLQKLAKSSFFAGDIDALIAMVMMEIARDNKLDLNEMLQTQRRRIKERSGQRELISAMKKEQSDVERQLQLEFEADKQAGKVDKGCKFDDYKKTRVVLFAQMHVDPETGKVIKESETTIVPYVGKYPSNIAPAGRLPGRVSHGGDKNVDVNLKTGAKGAAVEALQKALNALGADLDVDGKFGAATAQAVKDFQKANGLAVDGIVGPETLAKLGLSTADLTEKKEPPYDPTSALSPEEAAKAITVEGCGLAIDDAQAKLDSMGDQSQEDQLRLQQLLERYQKCFEVLSNTLKKSSDTQGNIISNLK